MKILITGGSGVIGYNLGCHLHDLGHEVHLVDVSDIGVASPEHPRYQLLLNFHYVDVTRLNSLLFLAHKIKPDRIIHLAEVASIDLPMHVEAMHTNLGGTSEFLYTCATLNIRGILGTWSALEEYDLLTYSLNQRASLLKFFQKGNCVVNQVVIPQIFHPELPASHFGNLVGRLWNHIEIGQPFFINEPSERHIINEVAYCDLERIYHTFDEQLSRNTRDPCYVDYVLASSKTLIGLALDVFDCEEATLVGRDEPREYKRIRQFDNHPIRQWINKAWIIADQERNHS